MDQEIIKSVASSSVLGKAYDDLVHPSAKSLGNTISLVPRTIGVWLCGWEKWVVNGEESVKRTIDAVGNRADNIPEEHLVEPPAHIAVPAIQQLAYCYDSADLREMKWTIDRPYPSLICASFPTQRTLIPWGLRAYSIGRWRLKDTTNAAKACANIPSSRLSTSAILSALGFSSAASTIPRTTKRSLKTARNSRPGVGAIK